MRRSAVLVTVLAMAGLVTSCDGGDDGKRAVPPSRPVATIHQVVTRGDLCQRLAGSLNGSWRAMAEPEVAVTTPVYDRCVLVDAAEPMRPVSVGVSVLLATRADLDRSRSAYDDGYGKTVPSEGVAIGDGGWGVHNSDRSYVVVLSHGRLIRLARDGDRRVFEELTEIAYVATSAVSALPVAGARTIRPECSSGTAAAQRILGGPATIRRDRLRAGRRLSCLWATATASVLVAGGGPESPQAQVFRNFTVPGRAGVRTVRVGDEAVYHPSGGVTFRLGRTRFVETSAEPFYAVDQAALVALASAVVPVYRG